MNGITLTVPVSQLAKLFGFSSDALAAILLLKPYKRIPGLLRRLRRNYRGWYTEPRRYRQRKGSRSAAARTLMLLSSFAAWISHCPAIAVRTF
jgi:hypothetical protein